MIKYVIRDQMSAISAAPRHCFYSGIIWIKHMATKPYVSKDITVDAVSWIKHIISELNEMIHNSLLRLRKKKRFYGPTVGT